MAGCDKDVVVPGVPSALARDDVLPAAVWAVLVAQIVPAAALMIPVARFHRLSENRKGVCDVARSFR